MILTCARCGKDGISRAGMTQHIRGKECLRVWFAKHGCEEIVTKDLHKGGWRKRQSVIWRVISTELPDDVQLAACRALLTPGVEACENNRLAFDTLEMTLREKSWSFVRARLRIFIEALVSAPQP